MVLTSAALSNSTTYPPGTTLGPVEVAPASLALVTPAMSATRAPLFACFTKNCIAKTTKGSVAWGRSSYNLLSSFREPRMPVILYTCLLVRDDPKEASPLQDP